ncbi:MAG TPA: hypothetical protein VGT81_22210 [Casimicrobiaceae bacterium]|nr:hypothetical protein [Casimicrobiaceae bacterium]
MSRNHESNNSSSSNAAIFRFLDAYENETYSDDDGALLGQLSMLRAGMFVEGHDDREWHEAVSYAVSAH